MPYTDGISIEIVGEYEYDRKTLLGHGSYALVYKGQHRKSKKNVAIKCVNKKNLEQTSSVLVKEIKILKELNHENIVRLYECEYSSKGCFLVMEYCNGGDLQDYLRDKGTLTEDTIRLFFRQIANAMKCMNDLGILHRDLKPPNMLLSYKKVNPKPCDYTVKIADFGFARHLQSHMMAATLCGSPIYMAPEVITSEQYNAKADLWSIGTIIYLCLVGRTPFQANSPKELRKFYEQSRKLEPRIPKGTSPKMADLIVRLLKKNVSERIDFVSFFNHDFFLSRKSTDPMPVPLRSEEVIATPNSSNTSDSRSLVESPRVYVACSPCENETQNLTGSSYSDSEDFVMVPHPFSCSDSINSYQFPSKDMKHCATVTSLSVSRKEIAKVCPLTSCHPDYGSCHKNHTIDSPLDPVITRYSTISSRQGEASSNTNAHQRQSLKISTKFRTTLSNNCHQMNCQGTYCEYSLFNRRLKSHGQQCHSSFSPLRDQKSVKKQSQGYYQMVAHSQLHNRDKLLRNPVIPTISENPGIGIAKLPLHFKCIFDYRNETLVSQMARAWTAPDLTALCKKHVSSDYNDDMTRSKSSLELQTNTLVGKSSEIPCSEKNCKEVASMVTKMTQKSLSNRHASPRDEVAEFQFYCKLCDRICEVAQEHGALSYDAAPTPFVSTKSSQAHKLCEQLLLYLKSLQLVATALHTLRNKTKGGTLRVTNSIKAVARELNCRYSTYCRLCADAKTYRGMAQMNHSSFTSADKILYLQAISDCQSAALDEMFNGDLQHCVKRYERALLFLKGLCLTASNDTDLNRLNLYSENIQYRLSKVENMIIARSSIQAEE